MRNCLAASKTMTLSPDFVVFHKSIVHGFNHMSSWIIHNGNCLDLLPTLPDRHFHCCVTSPPYFGLRAYLKTGDPRKPFEVGSEETPAAYVNKVVDVARGVRRVLRDDATFWLNVGDCYSMAGKNGGHSGNKNYVSELGGISRNPRVKVEGLKPKELCLIPFRLAIALQEDGWYVRSVIRWVKPSPMPEPVRDRPTSAVEEIFLLTKGQSRSRSIGFADVLPELFHFGKRLGAQSTDSWACQLCVRLASAIFDFAQKQENFSLPPFYAEEWKNRFNGDDGNSIAGLKPIQRAAAHSARFLNADMTTKEFLNQMHSLWCDLGQEQTLLIHDGASQFGSPSIFMDGHATIAVNDAGKVRKVDFVHALIIDTVSTGCNYFYDQEAERVEWSDDRNGHSGYYERGDVGKRHRNDGTLRNNSGVTLPPQVSGRNLWNWWKIANAPLRAAHYAAFPSEIPRRCISLGTSAHGACASCGCPYRRVVNREKATRYRPNDLTKRQREEGTGNAVGNTVAGVTTETVGWKAGCGCNAGVVPCRVLDPFAGAATTLLAAIRMGREATGLELNPEYVRLGRERLVADNPMFNGPAAAGESVQAAAGSPGGATLFEAEALL